MLHRYKKPPKFVRRSLLNAKRFSVLVSDRRLRLTPSTKLRLQNRSAIFSLRMTYSGFVWLCVLEKTAGDQWSPLRILIVFVGEAFRLPFLHTICVCFGSTKALPYRLILRARKFVRFCGQPERSVPTRDALTLHFAFYAFLGSALENQISFTIKTAHSPRARVRCLATALPVRAF